MYHTLLPPNKRPISNKCLVHRYPKNVHLIRFPKNCLNKEIKQTSKSIEKIRHYQRANFPKRQSPRYRECNTMKSVICTRVIYPREWCALVFLRCLENKFFEKCDKNKSKLFENKQHQITRIQNESWKSCSEYFRLYILERLLSQLIFRKRSEDMSNGLLPIFTTNPQFLFSFRIRRACRRAWRALLIFFPISQSSYFSLPHLLL